MIGMMNFGLSPWIDGLIRFHDILTVPVVFLVARRKDHLVFELIDDDGFKWRWSIDLDQTRERDDSNQKGDFRVLTGS